MLGVVETKAASRRARLSTVILVLDESRRCALSRPALSVDFTVFAVTAKTETGDEEFYTWGPTCVYFF